jgi:hypothetical protein
MGRRYCRVVRARSIVNVCPLIKVTGTHHGYEEKRKISLRESQVLLRNRRGKRVIGCRQRAQSSLRMWAGYETDVLKEFPARFELLVDLGANTRSFTIIGVA